MTLSFILLIVAIVLFGIAAAGVSIGRINTVAAGLFCWALSTAL